MQFDLNEPELNAEDVDALDAIRLYFELRGILGVRLYLSPRGPKWIVDLDCGEGLGHIRSKPRDGLGEAFVEAMRGRERVKRELGGRLMLQDLLHSGAVSKEDVEWAVTRFDHKGVFRK